MNSSPTSSRLLLAAAWIGTAALAYAIGSLRQSAGTPVAPASAPLQSGAAAGQTAISSGSIDSERPLDGGHGAASRTLAEITGDQPLGDYLKRVLALDDDIKRTSAFLELLETLKTPEDIRAALDIVAKSGRGWGRGAASREFSMLLQKWTAFDPKGAADYAAKSSGREERYMATSAVLKAWTRQDLEGALAWARTNGVPAADGPESQRGGSDGNYALAMIASQIARTDVDRALAIAAEDGDSRTSTRLDDTLVAEFFKQHGEEAARAAIMAMPQSKLRDAMLGEYADRLAKTNGPGAAQWAASLPAGLGRSRALSEAIAGWSDDDPAAAGNFLNSIPPSADSDSARERYARNVFDKDPVGALSWAATITDPRERQNTTEALVRSWVRRDTETAKQWVMQSAFSDETKQRLLTPDNSRGRN
jgi:hypothetical protein